MPRPSLEQWINCCESLLVSEVVHVTDHVCNGCFCSAACVLACVQNDLRLSASLQAVGPVALLSLLMRDRLEPLVPGSESNIDPNHPVDEAAQTRFDAAAIQVRKVCTLHSSFGAV